LPAPQFGGRRKIAPQGFPAGKKVEFENLLAVGGVGEFEAENFGVVFGLLQAVGGRFVGGLCFNDCDRVICAIAQDVVGTLLPTALRLAADEDYSTIGERALFVDGVRRTLPARHVQAWNYEFSASVRLSAHFCPRPASRRCAFVHRPGETVLELFVWFFIPGGTKHQIEGIVGKANAPPDIV